jgi:hypothetical protein
MSRVPSRQLVGFALLAILWPATDLGAQTVSFQNEVMAVLSRAGCNQGACHGNQNGKNGFKLSLRGQDPDFDYEALTRDTLGRRLNRLEPDASLLLAKATGAVPHEGGKRFAKDSLEYQLLRRWVAGGQERDPANLARVQRIEVTPTEKVLVEPAADVRLKVTASLSDGTKRDVTPLACFEVSNLNTRVDGTGVAQRVRFGETTVLVRYLDQQATTRLAFVPARPEFTWKPVAEFNFVDKHVFAKLKALRMQPSELCSDAVFLRRAYLDAVGELPAPEETRKFLADTSADKRARAIDQLLERSEFADFWALKWSDLLRNEEKVLDKKGVRVFHEWIRRAIVDRKPLNEFARELIAGRGSTYSEPAANYYRALRDPQTRAEATAQVFLGIRLQCAKCHNHPFDRWTQEDYHRWAALFARVQYRIIENKRTDKLDKHEFAGEQIVYLDRESEVTHPRTGDVLQPRFLGGNAPKVGSDGDRLAALADWVARPDNPYFARAQVNRVWFHLLGRGLVDPNDDFRASNPPANPALMEALAGDFVAHKFDLRHLVRTIMLSRTYQLSSRPNDTNADDDANFARGQIRPLQAEQLLDGFSAVLGVPIEFPGQPKGLRATQLPGVAPRERGQSVSETARFLSVFGKPVRSLSCECERSEDATLNQAFQLITGEMLNRMLSEPNNRIGKQMAAGKTNDAIVEELYLAALCRPPSAAERDTARKILARASDRRKALEDVAWGLVNAKEFLLRR